MDYADYCALNCACFMCQNVNLTLSNMQLYMWFKFNVAIYVWIHTKAKKQVYQKHMQTHKKIQQMIYTILSEIHIKARNTCIKTPFAQPCPQNYCDTLYKSLYCSSFP